jgi:Flp pilus assembly protein TadG
MAVETVLLAPLFLLFLMFLVAAGRIVEAQGEVNGAARDAARAASVQRTYADAKKAAEETGKAALSGSCAPRVSLTGTKWNNSGRVKVTISCELDLAFLGFGASQNVSGSSVVPLERFRRVG